MFCSVRCVSERFYTAEMFWLWCQEGCEEQNTFSPLQFRQLKGLLIWQVGGKCQDFFKLLTTFNLFILTMFLWPQSTSPHGSSRFLCQHIHWGFKNMRLTQWFISQISDPRPKVLWNNQEITLVWNNKSPFTSLLHGELLITCLTANRWLISKNFLS